MTVAQCIHFSLSRPSVFSVLTGCQSAAEVCDAITYLDASDEEKDYTPFINDVQNDFKGHCVYCSHCLPCPAGIDIATVNKYLDIAKLDEQNVPPSIRAHYAALAHGGADCISCGHCESRCPFDVPIIENMMRAKRVFQ
jgi:predicted aldo/keto reductase-like oxidoreductase